jgi:hypothetical protein
MRVDFAELKSVRTRFDEHNIKYMEDNIKDGKDVVKIEGTTGQARVEAGNVPADVPMPLLMKLGLRLGAIKEWMAGGS